RRRARGRSTQRAAASLHHKFDGRKRPASSVAGLYDASMRFQIHALPAQILAVARANPRSERLTAEGDEPLRCCLRNAREGEQLILFSYEPPIGDSPYREIGAVFAHAAPCDGPAG